MCNYWDPLVPAQPASGNLGSGFSPRSRVLVILKWHLLTILPVKEDVKTTQYSNDDIE